MKISIDDLSVFLTNLTRAACVWFFSMTNFSTAYSPTHTFESMTFNHWIHGNKFRTIYMLLLYKGLIVWFSSRYFHKCDSLCRYKVSHTHAGRWSLPHGWPSTLSHRCSCNLVEKYLYGSCFGYGGFAMMKEKKLFQSVPTWQWSLIWLIFDSKP